MSDVNVYYINNKNVAQTTVDGTKTWKDGNASNRAATINVVLVVNGHVVASHDVSLASGWKYV
ncbi:Cna B-type domain-containing protein, partial [Bacillus cereus]|uniref:Cna B-type domain-containing protein n=1 Tax=Bacillus cereus TaxID=1396 RepID=UPI003556CE2E